MSFTFSESPSAGAGEVKETHGMSRRRREVTFAGRPRRGGGTFSATGCTEKGAGRVTVVMD